MDLEEINFCALAEEYIEDMYINFEEARDGSYWNSEMQHNTYRQIVSSTQEMADYAQSIVDTWGLSYLLDAVSDFLSEDEIKVVIDRLKAEITSAVTDKANSDAKYDGVSF